jgi:1-acyl-sn-glycerol-3-phosphate acyltransferase
MFWPLKNWRRIVNRFDRCARTFFAAILLAVRVTFRIGRRALSLARGSSARRSRAHQRLMLAALTPKRAAAARHFRLLRRGDCSWPQIQRRHIRHPRRPPAPARSGNQQFADSGIPPDTLSGDTGLQTAAEQRVEKAQRTAQLLGASAIPGTRGATVTLVSLLDQVRSRYLVFAMLPPPRRLKASRSSLLGRAEAGAEEGWSAFAHCGNTCLPRRLRALRRALLVVLWTLLSMLVQSALVALPGPGKVAFARVYWSMMCRLLGLRVRLIGARVQAADAGGRPVVYVSNHSSWLDILVLGGRLHACFVAKEEVARWPLISWVARLGRTVYVRRQRATTARERDIMRERLAAGDNLILFPEGTTSDGSRVLPFRSAFLSIAQMPVAPNRSPPLVQPVSVVYDRIAYLPAGRATRWLFAWYGDMDIGSHFWRVAQRRGLRATVLLHAPLDPSTFPSRKALAQAAWAAVAGGAATLRQNRPARPVGASESRKPKDVPAIA